MPSPYKYPCSHQEARCAFLSMKTQEKGPDYAGPLFLMVLRSCPFYSSNSSACGRLLRINTPSMISVTARLNSPTRVMSCTSGDPVVGRIPDVGGVPDCPNASATVGTGEGVGTAPCA